MRDVPVSIIAQAVKELFLDANFNACPDLVESLRSARDREISETGKEVLDMIIENDEIAAREQVAICQDTGLAILFVELGQEVHLTGGALGDAVDEGVRAAYGEGYLRTSVVDDPVFDRRNTGSNTPAIIYTDIVPGEHIRLTGMAKGFGSENMSALGMLRPSAGARGVVDFVVETIRKAGPNPCPPTVVGVGIGGTADRAMVVAKKATARTIGSHNADERYAAMEAEILDRANRLGIGPGGLGGRITSLWVNVEYLPTHIAGLPVAVNICCHAVRHAERVI
ncbi:MAG TPA: fumarate hydratase [Rectinemataceae bacterium]|nr:fumarate hydratase [Rectinemataceae bacterium]